MVYSNLPYDIDAVIGDATAQVDVPDGDYMGHVFAVRRVDTPYGMEVLVVFVIDDGPYAGQQVVDKYFFGEHREAAAQTAGRLKTLAGRLGCDAKEITTLGSLMASLEGTLDAKVSLSKKTKPNPRNPERPYVNVFARLLATSPAADVPDAGLSPFTVPF